VMNAEPVTVAAGSLTDWPFKVGYRLGGYITLGCNRDGCHAEFARIHIGQIEATPLETTFGAGLALIEAHEAHCPTPKPVEPVTCNAIWAMHRCGQEPGHPRVGQGQGHRCKCGNEPAYTDRVTFAMPERQPDLGGIDA
jgi:hypothetical protein